LDFVAADLAFRAFFVATATHDFLSAGDGNARV